LEKVNRRYKRKKAWTDLKSFITVVTILLFAYCVIRQIPIPNELQNVLATVVGFFLGSKLSKEG
jgi:biotin transporter BioY